MVKNSHNYFYHFDGLGSVTAITDNNGTAIQRYDYDSFDNIVSMLNPNFKQSYTYTSREYDEETGLYFYRARYYDSTIGRFISEDPIGLAGGINQFVYVGNNAVNFMDPLGLFIYPLPPLSPSCYVGLAQMGYLAWQVHHREIRDRYGHCMAHCKVRKSCGAVLGDLLSMGIGIGKELYDEHIKGRGWEEEDIDANERGRTCSENKSCEEQCNIYPKFY